MIFTNLTGDVLTVASLAFVVEPGGQTPDLTDEQALGFVMQSERWAATDQAAADALIAADLAAHAVPVDLAPTEDAPAPVVDSEPTTPDDGIETDQG